MSRCATQRGAGRAWHELEGVGARTAVASERTAGKEIRQAREAIGEHPPEVVCGGAAVYVEALLARARCAATGGRVARECVGVGGSGVRTAPRSRADAKRQTLTRIYTHINDFYVCKK